MWVGGCEGEQAQSRVDLILGLMHLYRVPLALFVLLGSGCVVLFLLVCTVQCIPAWSSMCNIHTCTLYVQSPSNHPSAADEAWTTLPFFSDPMLQ